MNENESCFCKAKWSISGTLKNKPTNHKSIKTTIFGFIKLLFLLKPFFLFFDWSIGPQNKPTNKESIKTTCFCFILVKSIFPCWSFLTSLFSHFGHFFVFVFVFYLGQILFGLKTAFVGHSFLEESWCDQLF